MTDETAAGSQWHLDKKVPLGFLLALVVQTITLVWVGVAWKSDVDHRLSSLEKTDASRSDNGTRITVLEQNLGFIKETLARIERKLDREETPKP